MGTISSWKRKDGSTNHIAQIRIMREGVKVYQESQTFDRKPAAKAWIKKREAELALPGALERLARTRRRTLAHCTKRLRWSSCNFS